MRRYSVCIYILYITSCAMIVFHIPEAFYCWKKCCTHLVSPVDMGVNLWAPVSERGKRLYYGLGGEKNSFCENDITKVEMQTATDKINLRWWKAFGCKERLNIFIQYAMQQREAIPQHTQFRFHKLDILCLVIWVIFKTYLLKNLVFVVHPHPL